MAKERVAALIVVAEGLFARHASSARRPCREEPATVDVWAQGKRGGGGPHVLRSRYC
jgi:hypothetical protein